MKMCCLAGTEWRRSRIKQGCGSFLLQSRLNPLYGRYTPNVVPSDISRSAKNNGYASDALRHVSTCGRCCGAGKSKGGGGGEGTITSCSGKGTRFALIG